MWKAEGGLQFSNHILVCLEGSKCGMILLASNWVTGAVRGLEKWAEEWGSGQEHRGGLQCIQILSVLSVSTDSNST